jgi:hypothetical protein
MDLFFSSKTKYLFLRPANTCVIEHVLEKLHLNRASYWTTIVGPLQASTLDLPSTFWSCQKIFMISTCCVDVAIYFQLSFANLGYV